MAVICLICYVYCCNSDIKPYIYNDFKQYFLHNYWLHPYYIRTYYIFVFVLSNYRYPKIIAGTCDHKAAGRGFRKKKDFAVSEKDFKISLLDKIPPRATCHCGNAVTIGAGLPSASSGTIRNRVRRFFSFFRTEKRFP